MAHLVRRKPLNALVTLVTAEKNCFQESFKVNKTAKFIWQRVPDYRPVSDQRDKKPDSRTCR